MNITVRPDAPVPRCLRSTWMKGVLVAEISRKLSRCCFVKGVINMVGELFSPMHLLVILVIALLVFGPGKLPELGSSLGKAIKEFKKVMNDSEKTIEK